jgi:dTDP-4-dehydrorhamnose 3,5-epimerase
MKVKSTEFAGLKVVELDLWRDSRGFFTERYHEGRFKEAGLPHHFIQDNHSKSLCNVLRGLHFQQNPAQGKLVGVIRGKIWDVVVDIRQNSPTFGKHFALELSDENGLLLWIPGGFAHGFCVTGQESADVLYKVDSVYNPQSEGGICWSDHALNIPWPVQNPIVSEKDQKLSSFEEFKTKWNFS